MKQPDDYRQSDAPLRDNDLAGAFLDHQANPRRLTVERSFETQSGYLVLIKQLGSRYALSFKRQIGTPPTSSIFLTVDEGQRLANMFSSNPKEDDEAEYGTPAEDFKANIDDLRHIKRRKSPIAMPTTLFVISLVLWAVLAILAFQLQIANH